MLKKCMCLILSAVLTMTLVVQVWADEEVKVTGGEHENQESISTDEDKGADVDADGGDSSLDVKEDVEVHSSGDNSTPDIGIDSTPYTGIEVSAENSDSTVVTEGGVVEVVSGGSDTVTGVDAQAKTGGTIDLSAGGIDVKSNTGYARGIETVASGGSSESFIIGSDGIKASGAGAEGINIDSAGSAVKVDVKGGISAAGTDGVSDVTGIKAKVDGGSLKAAIGGDISLTGADATGIDVEAKGQSSVNVNVGGGINTENKDSTKDPSGLQLEASGDGTKVSARVAGDVKGSGMDSSVEIKTENDAKVDVVAEGTLSAGKEAAVAFAGSPDNVSLIIWKAEAGTDGSIVKEVIDNNGNKTLEKTAAAETLESSIHYIIRVDTSQSIDLGNTKEMSYTAPDGSVINYNTAKEGEKVAVKLNVPSGYVLKGVFSDEARQCSLQKEGGEYYLIVPKGGGVFVNMWLEAKSDSSKNDKDHETTYEGSEGNPVTAPNEAGSYTMGITEEKLEMSMTGSKLLNISFPAGTDRFTLNLADIQQYIEAGISQFVINTPYGPLEIPVNDLLPYLQAGIPVTFILNNGSIEVLVNGSEKLLSSNPVDRGQLGVAPQAEAEALQLPAEQQQDREKERLVKALKAKSSATIIFKTNRKSKSEAFQQAQQAVAAQQAVFKTAVFKTQAEAEALQQAAKQQQAQQAEAEAFQQAQQAAELQPQREAAHLQVTLGQQRRQQTVAEGHVQLAAEKQQTQQAEAGTLQQAAEQPQTQQAVAEGLQQAAEQPQTQQAAVHNVPVNVAQQAEAEAFQQAQQAEAVWQRPQQTPQALAAYHPQQAEEEAGAAWEAPQQTPQAVEALLFQQAAEQQSVGAPLYRQQAAVQQLTPQAVEALQQVLQQVQQAVEADHPQLAEEQQQTPQGVAEQLPAVELQTQQTETEAEALQLTAEQQRTSQAEAKNPYIVKVSEGVIEGALHRPRPQKPELQAVSVAEFRRQAEAGALRALQLPDRDL